MAQLVIRHPNGASDTFAVSRLKTTIGRSARSDVCIPDAFASRLHAEIRQEGDAFWLHDLGSANGTRLNGNPVAGTVPLFSGGEIQIGETRIRFENEFVLPPQISATLIADGTSQLDPTKTVSFASKRNPTTEMLDPTRKSRTDLLTLISKVGIALLSSAGLDETLNDVATLGYETVPAERVIIMLRDQKEGSEM